MSLDTSRTLSVVPIQTVWTTRSTGLFYTLGINSQATLYLLFWFEIPEINESLSQTSSEMGVSVTINAMSTLGISPVQGRFKQFITLITQWLTLQHGH